MNEKYLNSTAEDYVIETHVNSGWAYKNGLPENLRHGEVLL